MKQYNKIEICGTIGSIHTLDYGTNSVVARISVAVNTSYLSASENEYTNTQWFDVHVDSHDTSVDLKKLTKGDSIYVEGPMVSVEYIDNSGMSHYHMKVKAKIFKKISEE